MKICIIGNPNNIHVRRWLKHLISMGHIIHLIGEHKLIASIPKGVIFYDLTVKMNIRKLRYLAWAIQIYQIIHDIKPDILHAHGVVSAGWLGKMTNFHPFVVSGWGSDLLIEPHKSIFRRLLVLRVLAKCDRLTVPSPTLKLAAIKLGVSENKLRLIPWGVDTRIFKPGPDDWHQTRQKYGLPLEGQLIFCPRGISRIYQIDIAISAIKQVRHNHPNVYLVLLKFNVSPAYFTEIQKLIRDLGLDHNVFILPAQDSPHQMAALFRAANIVLSIPRSEGYGSSVYEALACGCATIISDLPVFKDELIHGIHTIKVPAGNITKTSEALSMLLKNPEIRKQLSINALQLKEEFTELPLVTETERLYAELIEGREKQ